MHNVKHYLPMPKKKPPTEQLTVSEAGALGGRARAAALTAKQRSAIAKKAAATRWANHKKGGNEK